MLLFSHCEDNVQAVVIGCLIELGFTLYRNISVIYRRRLLKNSGQKFEVSLAALTKLPFIQIIPVQFNSIRLFAQTNKVYEVQ